MRSLLFSLVIALFGFSPAWASQPESVPEISERALPEWPSEWIAVPGQHVVIWGPEALKTQMIDLARHGSTAVPRLANILGVSPGEEIRVILTPSTEVFQEIQPGRPPEWADATAWPAHDTIYLRSLGARAQASESIERVFDHEITHILLGRMFAPAIPPRWLHEGLAQSLAGEFTPEVTHTLGWGLASGNIQPFTELHRRFPADADSAHLAYAQSLHFIGWFRSTYGDEVFQHWLKSLAKGDNLDAAFQIAAGQNAAAIEKNWRAELDTAIPWWLMIAGSPDTWWSAAAVIGIGAILTRRRRSSSKLEEMRAAEAAEDRWWAAFRERQEAEGQVGPVVLPWEQGEHWTCAPGYRVISRPGQRSAG